MSNDITSTQLSSWFSGWWSSAPREEAPIAASSSSQPSPEPASTKTKTTQTWGQWIGWSKPTPVNTREVIDTTASGNSQPSTEPANDQSWWEWATSWRSSSTSATETTAASSSLIQLSKENVVALIEITGREFFNRFSSNTAAINSSPVRFPRVFSSGASLKVKLN